MAVNDYYWLIAELNNSAGDAVQVNRWVFQQRDLLIFDEPGEDLVEAFIDIVAPAYDNLYSSQYTLQTLRVRGITDPTYGYDRGGLSIAGVLTGERVANQVSAIITWTTGLVGRSYRGRTFLPVASEAQMTNGSWSNTYLGYMTAFGNAMLAMNAVSIDFAPWKLHVWSDTLAAATPVTGFITRSVPGTQRRRRLGRGS